MCWFVCVCSKDLTLSQAKQSKDAGRVNELVLSWVRKGLYKPWVSWGGSARDNDKITMCLEAHDKLGWGVLRFDNRVHARLLQSHTRTLHAHAHTRLFLPCRWRTTTATIGAGRSVQFAERVNDVFRQCLYDMLMCSVDILCSLSTVCRGSVDRSCSLLTVCRVLCL